MRDRQDDWEIIVDHKTYRFKCTSATVHRYRELTPRVRIPFDEFQESSLGITMLIEGLKFDMTEEMFLKRFGRLKDERYDAGHTSIVGIKFNYKEEPDKYVQGEVRIVFGGHVFLTFAHEWLALVFQAEFDRYMGGVESWSTY